MVGVVTLTKINKYARVGMCGGGKVGKEGWTLHWNHQGPCISDFKKQGWDVH